MQDSHPAIRIQESRIIICVGLKRGGNCETKGGRFQDQTHRKRHLKQEEGVAAIFVFKKRLRDSTRWGRRPRGIHPISPPRQHPHWALTEGNDTGFPAKVAGLMRRIKRISRLDIFRAEGHVNAE